MYDVDEAIRRHVLELEEPRTPDGMWHPSSLWGCARKAAYEIRQTPATEEPTIENKVVFRVGHILHRFIQDAVESDTRYEVYTEVPIVHGGLRIKGHADQLVCDPDGRWTLLEYKTINERGFKFVTDAPKDEHRLQALTYLYVLRERGSQNVWSEKRCEWVDIAPLGDTLDGATIYYLSKGAGMQSRTHHVAWEPEYEEAIRDRIAGLDQYRTGTLLPERLPSGPKGRHPLCGYCSFQTICYTPE